MSSSTRLRNAVDAVTTVEGVSETAAAMWVMVVEVLALAEFVPADLREALLDAARRWYLRSSEVPPLESWRVASWRFLQTKHGNSTAVSDRVDIAVRALICVLWDEEPTKDDTDLTLDYLGSLLDRVDREFPLASRGTP